jgi:acyl-CoA synthetase (AMP-forming)/AMP-acid ligase II
MVATLSEVRGKPIPDNLPTVWERFITAVAKYPNKIALACTHQPHDLFGIPSQPLHDAEYHATPYLRWKYSDLKLGVDRLSQALTAHGVRPGCPIVTFLPNGAEMVLTIWASNDLGCVLAPINPKNLFNKEEVSHMVRTVMSAEPGSQLVVIAGNADLARQADGLPETKSAIKIVLGESQGEWKSFEKLMDDNKDLNNSGSLSNGHTERSDDGIFFTSGTTSLPKGCRWGGRRPTSMIEMRSALPGSINTESICCVVAPNNHALGYLSLVASLCFGGTDVIPGPAFAPGSMLKAARLENCTHVTLVPTMVPAIMSELERRGDRWTSLQAVVLGGSLVTPLILKQCLEDLGARSVECGYGMTEGVLVATGAQSNAEAIVDGDNVCVGWALLGSGVRICAPSQKTPVARGVYGEIHSSGPFLCNGYIGQKSDDFYIDSEGRSWFVTGDQGVIDEKGRVFIVGRYKGSCHRSVLKYILTKLL